MIGRIALLLALAAATPLAAQHGAEAGGAVQPASPQVEAGAAQHLEEEGHGEGIDFMHHILDSREIELLDYEF